MKAVVVRHMRTTRVEVYRSSHRSVRTWSQCSGGEYMCSKKNKMTVNLREDVSSMICMSRKRIL